MLQRSKLYNLDKAGPLPGYTGHMPKGKMALYEQVIDEKTGMVDDSSCPQLLESDPDISTYVENRFDAYGQPLLKNAPLPKAVGENRLTENMVPGYTGYVPRKVFKYGETYRTECDLSIDEHIGNMKAWKEKEEAEKRRIGNDPGLMPLAYDPKVRDHLNQYNRQLAADAFKGHHKGREEPAIPGYKGKKEMFSDDPKPTRLYWQSGMIPNYTGKIPDERYTFGGTFGNVTRALEACAHDKECFGEVMRRSQPVKSYLSTAVN